MPKFKRKDIDRVNDDFSDFSLSSPATKIRRLDAGLPPIIEEEEFPVIEELPSSENEERAVVLFQPVNSHLVHFPSNFSVSVDSHIIADFKKQFLQSGHKVSLNSDDDETVADSSSNGCRAVVPWVRSVVPFTGVDDSPPDAMEADDMGEAFMDIEGNSDSNMKPEQGCGVTGTSEGFHQWPQPHCMIPQPPQNISSPITWFR